MKLGIEDIKRLTDNQFAETDTLNTAASIHKIADFIGIKPDIVWRCAGKTLKDMRDEVCTIVGRVYSDIKEYSSPRDIVFLERLLEVCKEYGLTTETAKMHRNLGVYYFQRNRINEAINWFDKAIQLAKSIKNDQLKASFYSNLGLIYFFNNDFTRAKRCYETVEGMILHIEDDDNIFFLHNYRYGILYSTMQEFEMARQYFDQALVFAKTKKDIGHAIMNIGVIYLGQRNFNKAQEYYNEAFRTFEEDDELSKSVICNNLAELYSIFGQQDKALYYINLAFEKLGNRNTAKVFIYFHTYTQIKMLMGAPDEVFDKFLELLKQVEDYHLYKSDIIEWINDMALLASENKEMLSKLETTVESMINSAGYENEEYKRELKICLNNINMYKYDMRKQKSLFI